MKLILYIRRDPKRGDRVKMHARLEAEPCYDTPRVSNFANEVKTSVDDIIAECERTGIITATQNLKMAKGTKA